MAFLPLLSLSGITLDDFHAIAQSFLVRAAHHDPERAKLAASAQPVAVVRTSQV